MTFRCSRVSVLRVLAMTSLTGFMTAMALAQAQAPVPPVAPQTAPQAAPPGAPQTTTPAAPTQAAPPPVTANVPDYPDPRGFEIGVFYWLTTPSQQPNLLTGNAATGYETLTDLGRMHDTPGIEASYPITRTGTLHVEAFETKGDGSQTAPVATNLFTTPVNAGDYLVTQYQIRDVKVYLDDLLFPHKFPVSRLRFKSLWGVEYLAIHTNVNAPYVTAGEVADGTSNVILPVFGLAAEYALTKHILFRLDGSGFGIPHHADLWDAAATLSWRVGHVEVFAGGKAVHFKSSPQSTEYQVGTLDGAYAGVRWHL